MTQRWRAREMGLTMGLLPTGPLNAITDVAGVRVGHVTLVEGSDIRTGLTAILPHAENPFEQKVLAAVATLNGYGKAMGFEQVREVGTLESPILLCSTLDVGRVADDVVHWLLQQCPELGRSDGTCSTLVAECFDGYLNNARLRIVQREHVVAAIRSAEAGPVAEGNVGAGTGMSGFQFKGGIGTSSRTVATEYGGYTVGSLVVLNCGRREQLQVSGVPVGRALPECTEEPHLPGGSMIMVVATDAPMSSRQLGRLARRAPLGLARTGAVATHRSGDFVVAFSTAQRLPHRGSSHLITRALTVIAEEESATIDSVFQSTVEATEEAIINALCMAQTMQGRDAHVRHALPLDLLTEQLQLHSHAQVGLPIGRAHPA